MAGGSTSKLAQHTKEGLANAIRDMVQGLALDAVGISEVYNLKDDDKHDERQMILRHPLSSLNSSAARPAALVEQVEQPGHYPKRFKTPKTDKERAEYC